MNKNALEELIRTYHEEREKISPKSYSGVQPSAQPDEMLLQTLLEPAQTSIKLSWAIWQDDAMPMELTHSLHNLERRLTEALELYHGRFYRPALRMLAEVHELLGKQAVERMATQEAIMHFQEMYDIAKELEECDLLVLATIYQAAMFRRTQQFQASFRRLDAAEKSARRASLWLRGLLSKTYARNYYVYGDEQGFLRSIERAESIADNMEATVDTVTYGFDTISVLEERAQGHTMLWQPEKALAIYRETDKMHLFRPLRERSSSHIMRAQAYCYSGDLQTGIEHALTGLRIAEKLQSSRYVMRLQQMCDRLSATPIGKECAMQDLRCEIVEAQRRLSLVYRH